MLKNTIVFTFTTLICEIILLGNGKWSEFYFSFNFRKLAFIFLLLMLIVFLNIKKISKEFFILMLLPVIAFIIWGLFIPMFYNTSIDYSISEGLIIMGFAFMPLLVNFFSSNFQSWEKVKKLILIALIFNSIFHILLYLSVSNLAPNSSYIIEVFENILNPNHDSSLNMNNSSDEIRVGWIGSIFIPMLIGGIFLFQIKIYFRILLLAIGFCALYMNAQRGIYFSIVYAALCTYLLYRILKISFLKNVRNYFLPITVLFSVIIIYYSSNPEFLEAINMSRPGSDDIRYSQSSILLNEFESFYLFGKGLGATVSNIIRNEESPYSFEQFMLSLLMKFGLVGIILFFYYCGLWVKAVERKSFDLSDRIILKKYLSIFFLMLTLFSASTSNPYLFNFVGIFYVYFIVVEYVAITNNK